MGCPRYLPILCQECLLDSLVQCHQAVRFIGQTLQALLNRLGVKERANKDPGREQKPRCSEKAVKVRTFKMLINDQKLEIPIGEQAHL